jgi:hypothetical protein
VFQFGLIVDRAGPLVISGGIQRRPNVEIPEQVSPAFADSQMMAKSTRPQLAHFMLELSTSNLRFMEFTRGVRADDG